MTKHSRKEIETMFDKLLDELALQGKEQPPVWKSWWENWKEETRTKELK